MHARTLQIRTFPALLTRKLYFVLTEFLRTHDFLIYQIEISLERTSKSSVRICQKLIRASERLPDGAALPLHYALCPRKRISMFTDQK